MAPKETTSFIINALSSIQESLATNAGVLRETSEKVSSVDKKTDVLAEKIISYDSKHEMYHREVTERVKLLEDSHKVVRQDIDGILGWKGKLLFLVSAITFLASILGINGIDLLESVLKKKNVDIPYVTGIQSYPDYGQNY